MIFSRSRKLIGIFGFIIAACGLALVAQVKAQLRNINVSDKMPEFSLIDPNGDVFSYRHGQSGVQVIAFLSADQEQSKNVLMDIRRLAKELPEIAEPFDFLIVMDSQETQSDKESEAGQIHPKFHFLIDTDHKLWGQLGVIAKPTIVLVGKDDSIRWIEAGYSYDFFSSLRSHFNSVLGIAGHEAAEEPNQVRMLQNGTQQAKVQMHLQMSGLLEQKGKIQAAVSELQEARQLDPNSAEVLLRLGELYCKSGQSEAALSIAGQINAQTQQQRAETKLIYGWAKRQTGQMEDAEKFLLEATQLNPALNRAFFELGKIYEAQGRSEDALNVYRTALSRIFPETINSGLSH
ncbi:MAG: tetratricopeptide repeat protein [Phycisphaerae bacterium]|nr:tetratricopeptide repeat protein [Phycisphaerae bacterium]